MAKLKVEIGKAEPLISTFSFPFFQTHFVPVNSQAALRPARNLCTTTVLLPFTAPTTDLPSIQQEVLTPTRVRFPAIHASPTAPLRPDNIWRTYNNCRNATNHWRG